MNQNVCTVRAQKKVAKPSSIVFSTSLHTSELFVDIVFHGVSGYPGVNAFFYRFHDAKHEQCKLCGD